MYQIAIYTFNNFQRFPLNEKKKKTSYQDKQKHINLIGLDTLFDPHS